MSTHLLNRDRLFSLSSITSPASIHLGPIENEKTIPSDGARFYKKYTPQITQKKEKEAFKGQKTSIKPRAVL